MEYNAIDLFCGCGGMSLGLEKAGFNVLYATDINADALKTYTHNFPHVLVEQGDITKINPHDVKRRLKGKKIHLISAGTPCQGFSTSGRRNPNDPRNKLFKQLLKFVKIIKPNMFIMENVSGLFSMENGKVFEKIKKYFTETGYHVNYKILSASDYGVPQNRKRIFIVGTTKNILEKSLFPEPHVAKPVTVGEAISDLSFLGVNDKSHEYKIPPRTEYQKIMRRNGVVLYNHESPKHSAKIQKRFSRIPQGRDAAEIIKNQTNKRDLYRLDSKKPSRTITTLPEDFIHFSKNRIPTVREMARLQSFPDNFVFLGPRTTGGKHRKHQCPQYTQVGNAVPPLMGYALSRNVLSVLGRYYVEEPHPECMIYSRTNA